jgi:hypothetical protein
VKKFLIPLVLLYACAAAEEKPERLLSREQMVGILTDIHIAEAKANRTWLRSYDSLQLMYKAYENDVFKKHKTDSTVYRQSYKYYLEHMQEMDEIYTAVVDTLSLRESLGKID